MKRLPVPGAALSVTQLGLGCARLFGGRELRHAAGLLEAALKHGITHFDTAPAYGSEAVLGEVLAGCPVTITTKVGLARYQRPRSLARGVLGPVYRRTARGVLSRLPRLKARLLATVSAAPAASTAPQRALGRGEVLSELELSLKHLRRSSIDLYLLHEPAGLVLTDELRELFAELQRDGTIKAYGLAFGGAACPMQFGTVLQGRAPIELPPSGSDLLCVSHGVIRHAADRTRIPTLVAATLRATPEQAVLFSASSPHQIRQIVGACEGLTVSPS